MYNPGTHSSLPFLTAQIDGIGGVIKMCEEDFFVEELPLYPPCGDGTHVYAQIEKKGVSTMDALAKIAVSLRIPRRDIGYAGQKDARAVTRQWISVEHINPDSLLSLNIPDIKIIQIARHTNKLKLGHLACNRFVIRIRNLKLPVKQSARITERIIAILIDKGVPNYFGSQRFGLRNETHLLGEALSKNKINEFVDIFLGKPEIDELPTFALARSFYEKGDYEKAHKAWPYSYSDQRRALKALIANKGNKKKAYHVVDKRLKGFFVSAYQSDLFNQVLASRMPGIDKLVVGDMAYKHINGACFRVDDDVLEQPRCDDFEISPTGPLLGSHMTRLTGPAGDIENLILDSAGLESRDFQQMGKYGGRGSRRPLRFQCQNTKVTAGRDKLGPYIELQFKLDSGCYATSLIREISKTNL
jgi:tRNA pseudouridine13 synthase